MKREILYKAKAINRDPNRAYRTNYQNGDWIYGLISRHDEYATEMTDLNGVSGIDVDIETVCEYTGLTDKNGTKIFEGDIVKQYYELCPTPSGDNDHIGCHIGVVKLSPSLGCFMRNPISEDDILGTRKRIKRCVPVRSYRSVVIGNAFDNPELLKGDE